MATAAILAAVLGVTTWLANPLEDSHAAATETVMGNTAMPVAVWSIGRNAGPARYEEYRGLVTPARASELAFQASGNVRKVYVQVGDAVAKGEVLAELDDDRQQAALAAARARRDQAVAELAQAERGPRYQTIETARADWQRLKSLEKQAASTLAREEQLFAQNASSQRVLDDARFALQTAESAAETAEQRLQELEAGTRSEQIDVARANLEAAEANRDLAQVEINYGQLLAPFDGHISRRFLDEGSIVRSGQSVLKVIEDGRLETRIGLPEDRAAKLSTNQTVELRIAEKTFKGKVIRLEPDLDASTQTRAVEIAILPSKDDSPLPGQMAVLRLRRDDRADDDAYWLPADALVRSYRGLWAVYVLKADLPNQSTLERLPIRILDTDGAWVLARGSLREGEQIVAEGVHRVGEGMRVEVAVPLAADDTAATPLP